MSWQYEIAQRIKQEAKQARTGATGEASFFLGTVESTEPLKISANGGELLYTEGDDLLITRTVRDYNRDVSWPVTTSHVPGTATRTKFLKTGMTVLLAPVGSIKIAALIDILEDG